jgi:hypothetical protein
LRVWAPYLCHRVITGFHSWITAKALKVCGLGALASARSQSSGFAMFKFREDFELRAQQVI